MRLKTFRAKTMADALVAVKKDLGKDAVILHTRSVKVGGWLGIGARRVVEIIASDEVNVAGPRVRASARGSATTGGGTPTRAQGRPAAQVESVAGVGSPTRAAVEAYRRAGMARSEMTGSEAAAELAALAVERGAVERGGGGRGGSDRGGVMSGGGVMGGVDMGGFEPESREQVAVLPVRKRGQSGGAGGGGNGIGGNETGNNPGILGGGSLGAGGADRERLDRLRTPVRLAPQDGPAHSALEAELALIKAMVGQVLQSSTPTAAAGMMPEALFKQYLKLLEGQVARDVADRIVGAVRDELNAGELSDESIVRQTMLRHIAALIPVAQAVAAPSRAADGRSLTIALVGPTGVGKTTTIAKLAAAYKLRYGKKVGLITSDTYRIAAVEQLRTYANIISLPLKVVMTPAEMAAACESLADCDVILIDTAGRSPNDAARLDELRAFIDAARPHETHLVLSTATSEAVLLRAAEQFAVAQPNRLILTKLDEAVSFGVVINVAERLGAKCSFVTTGQEVPDHIEPGHADRLARLVLDGELGK